MGKKYKIQASLIVNHWLASRQRKQKQKQKQKQAKKGGQTGDS